MNYKLIIIGLIFIFNPEINIVDFLPDFIGILFILKAITPMSRLLPSVSDSASYFKKYLVVSAVKIISFIPLLSVAVSDPAFYLVFTFTFAVLSIIFMVPAISTLFSGIQDFTERNAVTLNKSKLKKIIITISFISRNALSVIPELIYLYIDDQNVYDSTVYPLAPYKSAIITFSVSIAAVTGIAGLICAIKYFCALKSNSKFNKLLNSEISDIKPDPVKTTVQKSSITANLLTISAIFLIPIFIDGKQFLPLFVSSLCIYFAVKSAKNIVKSCEKKLIYIPLTSFIMGIISYISIIIFNTKYQKAAVANFSRVADKFIVPAVLNSISCIIYIFALMSVYKIVTRIIDLHTGTFWEAEYLSHNSYSAKEKTKLKVKFKIGIIAGILLSVSNAVSYCLLYIISLYQIINSAIVLAWVFYMSSTYSSIKISVKEKYADEGLKLKQIKS